MTKFKDNLVEFDYETWRKFGLKLYWPHYKGDLSIIWPMRILAIREHPSYQMVGLVKEGALEEVVTFSKDTGRDQTGRYALMDLDSLRDPVIRANTTWEILRSTLSFFWDIVRMFKMIMFRSSKEKYNEYRRKKSAT